MNLQEVYEMSTDEFKEFVNMKILFKCLEMLTS